MSHETVSIIFYILLTILCLPYVLIIVDAIWDTHWSCKLFGWHNGKGQSSDGVSFDGCSVHAQCSKCGKDVMQDSQGNWF